MLYMRTSKFFTDSIKCYRILCSFIIYNVIIIFNLQKKKKIKTLFIFQTMLIFFDCSEMYRTPVAMSKTGIKSNAQCKRSIYLTKIMFLLVRKLIFPRMRLTVVFRFVFYKYKNNLEICWEM